MPKVFFRHLDGFRMIAFLAVFISHAVYTTYDQVRDTSLYSSITQYTRLGALGVNFFFVLSGFLITYLLLKEEQSRDKIDIINFYIRRVLRIWPLYFLCVFLGFVLYPLILTFVEGVHFEEHANVIYYIFFISNFDYIHVGRPNAPFVGLLWSVAIEEQFYLLWPILLVVFKKVRPFLFLSVIFASMIFRFMHVSEPEVLEFHSFSVMSDLAMGGLFAWLLISSDQFIRAIQNLDRWVIVASYVTGIAVVLFGEQLFNNVYLIPFYRLIVSLFFVFIIVEQNYAGGSFYKIGKHIFLSKWGTYTYGLYCYHLVAIFLVEQVLIKAGIYFHALSIYIIVPAGALLVSMLISHFSYHYFERIFLKYKERFSFLTK